MTRPMNCWVQARKNGPWHQAEYDGRWHQPRATLCCSGRKVRVSQEQVVMEYRGWRPVNRCGSQCQQAACQRDVSP